MQLVTPRLNARLIAYGNGTHCVYLIYIYMVYYIHAYILKLKFLHLHLLAENSQEKVLVS